jgi:steroid 5-alpha reductase family enzyme
MESAAGVLVLSLGTAFGLSVLLWVASVIRRDASIVDPFWGIGFIVLAWLYFFTLRPGPARGPLVVALVTVWGARLSWHLFRRNWGKGEDYRYREMRESHAGNFAVRSLFTVFLLQAAVLWVVALPLFQATRARQPERLTPLDVVGGIVYATGLLFEAVGDRQLARFRSDPSNRGKVLESGLWRYTRHPNYFGDAMVWWGIFLIALATPGSAWTVASPALMTFLLMKVSGVALLEQKLRETKPEYREYARRTSAFFPWPPKRRRSAALSGSS